jgi:hypothetical protein
MYTDEQVQEHYDDFFEEIFVELEDKVGHNVCYKLMNCNSVLEIIMAFMNEKQQKI